MNKKMKIEIINLLTKYNFEIVNFEYYKKVFGNIVLVIKNHDKKITFVTDRGDIYCEGIILCNHEYLRTGSTTTFEKLIEQIEIILKREATNCKNQKGNGTTKI